MTTLIYAGAWLLIGGILVVLPGCAALERCRLAGCTGDAEIAAEIRLRLNARPALRFDDLRIQTLDHIVYLRGLVDTEQERREALSIARGTRDVAKVIDAIGVRGNW